MRKIIRLAILAVLGLTCTAGAVESIDVSTLTGIEVGPGWNY